MIFTDTKDFAAAAGNKKILALDIGGKNIGMAVGNMQVKIPSPAGTIRTKKFTLDVIEIKKIIDEYDVGGLVIGLPLNMDGSEGKACQSVRQFGRNILKEFEIAIIFFDERLSTYAAEGMMKEAGASGKNREDHNDAVAASIILQNFFSQL